MGLLTCKRSSQPVDRALPRIKKSWKKSNPRNRPEESLQPVPNKMSSDAFCESEIEDNDLEMQLKLAEVMSDESNCMWLSSDCDSSSLFSSDISDLCLIDRAPLMKSENDDSTVHHLQIGFSGELSKEDGAMNDQSVCSYESRGFSHDRFLDRVNPLSESSFSSPSSISSYQTEICGGLLEEFNYDEPLFWPYNKNMYESSGLDKSFLCVSPRKKKMAGKKEVHVLKSVEVKPRKTTDKSAKGKILQQQCGRRIELNQMSKKPAMGWKSIAPTSKNFNKSQRLPSQLRTSSSQASANQFPINTSTKRRINSTTKETLKLTPKNHRNKVEQLPIEPLLEFEASFFHDIFIKGATIEKIVGLNEFDALEWLNFSFSEGCFIQSAKKEESSQAGIEAFFLPV